jgi:cytochrome oxidase Cu insertion factor (SCO1/SenC/PrrC family)
MTRVLPTLILTALATNLSGGVVELAPQRGRAVAAINWTDETGRSRQLSEFGGYPLILLPIYTRCRSACVQNVNRLKEALADSLKDPTQFRVLLLSFDATDNPAALSKYRTRERIPLAWSLGSGTPADIDAMLETLGVQVGKAGTEFTHPNVVFYLDAKLRIAKWTYGTDYSGRDVDLALKIASGQNDWLGKHAEWFYALLLFASSILCVLLCYYTLQLNFLRRTKGTSAHQRVEAVTSRIDNLDLRSKTKKTFEFVKFGT